MGREVTYEDILKSISALEAGLLTEEDVVRIAGEVMGGRPAAPNRRGYDPDDINAGPLSAGAPSAASPELGLWLNGSLQASLQEGTGGGQFIVPPQHLGAVFDRLAARSVGLASGFTVIDTDSDELHIPRLTADSAAAWTAEGAAITTSEPGIDEVIARPRKLAALVQCTNEIVDDSNPQVLDVVQTNLFRALALKLDLGFFEGSGSAPEIRGLKNVAGIGSVVMGANGAPFANLDPFADALGLLGEANAQGTAIVMHPRSWKALTKLKEQPTANNKPLLQESAGSGGQGIERTIYGVPVFLTSQLSIAETQGTANNASSAFVYQADEVIAVRRRETRIEFDRSRLFDQDMSEVRAVLRFDVAVPNPPAVVRIAGIIP